MAEPKKPEQYIELLRRYNSAYYNLFEPEISDDAYDALKSEFRAYYPDHPFLKEIGAPVEENSAFFKATHEIPMNSQNKASNEAEFRAWAKNAAVDGLYCVSEKLDGLSLGTTYWNGVLRQGVTRGDGITGFDITRNVRLMQNPQRLPTKITVTVRGEIIMHKSIFHDRYTEKKNPRNAAGGLTKRLDGEGCSDLNVYYYDIISEGVAFKTQVQKFDYIKNTLNLPTPFYKLCTLEEVIRLHEEYEERKRAGLDYEIDGLIVCVNDLNRQEFMGEKDLIPKYSIAYKFESQEAPSKMIGYRLQVGRTGKVTPVAEIEPVTIAGATITNVTLHNFAEIERLGLRQNSEIMVKRSGDVIPKITKVLNPEVGEKIPVPENCPECNAALAFNDIEAKCINIECSAKITKSLIHWLTVLEVMHFGEKLVEQLEERGFLKDVSDFYKLKEEDIAHIEGRGFVIAQKVLKELHDRKEMSVGQLLTALSIPSVSDKTAKMLSSEFGTLEKILNLKVEDLIPVSGVGEILANSIVTGLLSRKEIIDNLKSFITIKEVQKISNSLSGKTFCFTGVRPDKSLEEKLEANGGKIVSGVSKKLSYLVTNEANSDSTKAVKARELGIPVISMFDLEKMVN